MFCIAAINTSNKTRTQTGAAELADFPSSLLVLWYRTSNIRPWLVQDYLLRPILSAVVTACVIRSSSTESGSETAEGQIAADSTARYTRGLGLAASIRNIGCRTNWAYSGCSNKRPMHACCCLPQARVTDFKPEQQQELSIATHCR